MLVAFQSGMKRQLIAASREERVPGSNHFKTAELRRPGHAYDGMSNLTAGSGRNSLLPVPNLSDPVVDAR